MSNLMSIRNLEKWLLDQCNNDWEHQYGISIFTYDNPAWGIEIDINDTDVENKEFAEINIFIDEKNFLHCKIIDKNGQKKFKGTCSIGRIEEIVDLFIKWAAPN